MNYWFLKDRPQRAVRSFVLRNQRMTPAQELSLGKHWEDYGLTSNEEGLNFDNIFARSAPTVLEIGSGNGDLIIDMASRHPQRNYIAVEVYRSGVGALLSKAYRLGLTNLKVIHEDIEVLVDGYIPDHAFDEVLIMFSDPWPKKRHHKRRLIGMEFIQALARTIKPQGFLYIATDWQHYADSIYREVASSQCYRYCDTTKLERLTTAFERRAVQSGRKIFNFSYQVI